MYEIIFHLIILIINGKWLLYYCILSFLYQRTTSRIRMQNSTSSHSMLHMLNEWTYVMQQTWFDLMEHWFFFLFLHGNLLNHSIQSNCLISKPQDSISDVWCLLIFQLSKAFISKFIDASNIGDVVYLYKGL